MHFVYDFDSTLYATKRLWERWVEHLLPFGFPVDRIHATMEDLSARGFSCPGHARMLGVSEPDVQATMERFTKQLEEESPAFIYPDVLPWLAAQRELAIPHSVVTAGDAGHQWLKINSSGLDKHLTDVRIANSETPKVQHLRDLLASSSGPLIFVDDNPKELQRVIDAALPVELIRIVRTNDFGDYAHPGDDRSWPVIRSLDELRRRFP